MSDEKKGSGPPGEEAPPAGPLAETFPEFIDYARKRRKKGARQAPETEPPTPRKSTVNHGLMAVVSVGFFVAGMFAYRLIDPGPQKTSPAWAVPSKQKASKWTALPKPATMGQVPDSWAGLRLGTRRAQVNPLQLVDYSGPDRWADQVYTADPEKPEVFFGLSFFQDKLYKISLRMGTESTIGATQLIGMGPVAYGQARGYEYMLGEATHLVTIFQTESRALKMDTLRGEPGEDGMIYEVTLVDLDVGAAREADRARHPGR